MNARRPFSLSRKSLFLLLFFSSAGGAQETPKVTLERIFDGRGNRVGDVAKAEVKKEGARRSAWVLRGLFRSDLLLTMESAGRSEIHAIGFTGRPALRFESPASGGRVTASSPASSFRYFETDVATKTVRCNLSRLAEETDYELLPAAGEYFEQDLEEDGLASEELPLLTLRAIQKRPPPASPPIRRRVPWTEGGPEADDLAAAARAALPR
jgi:hypothetical protein